MTDIPNQNARRAKIISTTGPACCHACGRHEGHAQGLDHVRKEDPEARAGHSGEARSEKNNRLRFLLVAVVVSMVGCYHHQPENSAAPPFDLAAHCRPKEAWTKQQNLPCKADTVLKNFESKSVADFSFLCVTGTRWQAAHGCYGRAGLSQRCHKHAVC